MKGIYIMNCELLINAPASTIFSFYHDPYHWNIIFSGVNKAYLDKYIAAGAKGVVETSAGCWRMRVVQVFDDHKLVIRLAKGAIFLYFNLIIQPINQNTCRVSHAITTNFVGALATLFFRKSINKWLHLNLLIVQQQAQKKIAADATSKIRKLGKSTKRKTK